MDRGASPGSPGSPGSSASPQLSRRGFITAAAGTAGAVAAAPLLSACSAGPATQTGSTSTSQLAKIMPDRVRSVITLGSPFAGNPRSTNAWRIYEMASGHRADTPDERFGGSLAQTPPKGSAQIVLNEATVCLPLGSLIDLQAEAARLQKELAKVTEEIARLHNKLSNEKFVANAPEEVVEAEREKHAEYREAQEKLSVALTRVRDAG